MGCTTQSICTDWPSLSGSAGPESCCVKTGAWTHTFGNTLVVDSITGKLVSVHIYTLLRAHLYSREKNIVKHSYNVVIVLVLLFNQLRLNTTWRPIDMFVSIKLVSYSNIPQEAHLQWTVVPVATAPFLGCVGETQDAPYQRGSTSTVPLRKWLMTALFL